MTDGVIAHQSRLDALGARSRREQDQLVCRVLTVERGEDQGRGGNADRRIREGRLIREEEFVGGSQVGDCLQEATDVHQPLAHTLEVVRRLNEQSLGLLHAQRRHDLERERDGANHQGRGIARAGAVCVEVADDRLPPVVHEAGRDRQVGSVRVDVDRGPVVGELGTNDLGLAILVVGEVRRAHRDHPREARGVVVGLHALGGQELTVIAGGRHHDDPGLVGAVCGFIQAIARRGRSEAERDDARAPQTSEVNRITDQLVRRRVETRVEHAHGQDLALRSDSAQAVVVLARSHERRDASEVIGSEAVDDGRLEDFGLGERRILILLDEVVPAGRDGLDVVRMRRVAAVHDGDEHPLAGGVLPGGEHIVLALHDLDLSLVVERIVTDEEALRLEHLLAHRAGGTRAVVHGLVARVAPLSAEAAEQQHHQEPDAIAGHGHPL